MTSHTLYLALKDRIERLELENERLRQALNGIATCATKCGCCEMHRRIAERALECASKP